MASPQVEAAEIMAAAIDRQTAALVEIGRTRLIGGLIGQLFSNVAFRHHVRIPSLTTQTQAEVAALATSIEDI
jgi:hypothetical protein